MTRRKGHNGGDYTPEACRDPEAKERTRRRAIEIAQQSPCLWSKSNGTLRCDWMELAGRLAPTLQTLRSMGALGNRRFIGVDTAPDIIRECEAHYGQDNAVWVNGDLLNVMRMQRWRPTIQDVGVIGYDSHDSAKGRPIESAIVHLDAFARNQWSLLGAAMLVVNVAAPPRFVNKEQYVGYLSKFLTEKCPQKPIVVSPDNIVEYRSGVIPMWWIALTYGF